MKKDIKTTLEINREDLATYIIGMDYAIKFLSNNTDIGSRVEIEQIQEIHKKLRNIYLEKSNI